MRSVETKNRGNFQKQLKALQDSVNEQAAVIEVRDTALAVTQTDALLNAKYPKAGVFSKVYAPNVGSGFMYVKVTATLWHSVAMVKLAAS
jgi:hypothetical protein